MVVSNLAQAELIYSCKKRNPFSYSAYDWTELEKLQSGEIIFRFGNGIDSQMLEVFFESPVKAVGSENFEFQNESYSLKVQVQKSVLSYLLKSGSKSISKNGFQCVDQSSDQASLSRDKF